eukprot:gb/GECG01014972.1/.p1 GENE.gb/GECG01014972.1/~~gb/GECG01014972.1/.p1  ORF type:complete len:194 (+),score=27.80 gb/GECG01014972.1/:1-582(+)
MVLVLIYCCANAKKTAPSLVFIKDTRGKVFGGFSTAPWHAARNYYGGFQSFVFTLGSSLNRTPAELVASSKDGSEGTSAEGSAEDSQKDEEDDELNTISRTVSAPAEELGSGINVYKWSGGHSYFQFSPGTAIAMGGGGGFAWYLDQDLLHGTSGTSQTFANPCLATSKDFKCVDMEIWGLFEPRGLSKEDNQ